MTMSVAKRWKAHPCKAFHLVKASYKYSIVAIKLYYISLGLSIKYVTLFLANFDPLPLSHFVTHPGTPQK